MATSEPTSALTERAQALVARIQRDQDHGDEALVELEAVIARLRESDRDEDATRVLAFAQLTLINLLVAAGRPQEAAAAAGGLLAVFAMTQDGPTLTGLGTMLLDVCFWLLTAGQDREALSLATALVARLGDGDEAQQAVAAGGRFFAAQTAGRLGAPDDSRAHIAALCDMGEPAIVALERVAAQFGGAETNPAWHAQIAATTATVLWRLGRLPEAHALADHAARRFGELGLTPLQATLRELAEEIAAA
jgi:hypothetical protein